ncbi:MAG: hypothetical protein ACYTFT_17615 [Planctomycetota bacterium]|jgi:hypothetical protein
MADPQEEGIDIIKFFLGVMTLLTVFVGAFAVYNWSASTKLAETVRNEEVDLGLLKKDASEKALLDTVARSQTYAGLEDFGNQDFGQFLTEKASQMDLTLQRSTTVGGGRQNAGKAALAKISRQFSIDDQPLDVIVAYLWFIQGSWPGLKVEALNLSESRGRRGEETYRWNAQITATIFRPNAATTR